MKPEDDQNLGQKKPAVDVINSWQNKNKGLTPPSAPSVSEKLHPSTTSLPSNSDVTPLPEPPGPPKGHDGWKSIASTILLLLLAPLIALSITMFVMQSYQVDGQSMETTLQNNDRLIVDKFPRTWSKLTHRSYVPHRADIIIFNQIGLPDSGLSGQKQLIKRVVGLPGETIKVNNGKVTVYNSQYTNGFNPDQSGLYRITASQTPGEVQPTTLGPNEIFVMGDNRPNSEDSRYFGPISTNQIVGKLVLRLLPVSKIEKF